MILSVRDLSFSYGKKQILHDVSFETSPGRLISVLGANGAGKSTLFRCILGSLPISGGEITLDGKNAEALSVREKAKYIAYIPQTHRPTFGYTVLDTVLMGTSRQIGALSQPKKVQLELAVRSAEMLGIEELLPRSFTELSGGEQQLVLIARAISQQADIFLMDEPTSSLDFGNQHVVLKQIRKLCENGYTVLLSTHNPQQALQYADDVLALSDGTCAAFGEAKTVCSEALMEKLYHMEVAFAQCAHGTAVFPK